MKYSIQLKSVYKSYLQSAAYENSLQMLLKNLGKRLLRKHITKPTTIQALKDITFEVGVGERFGIIGPNGSGKSTLLKLLSKITFPTEGSIKIEGRVASLLEIGTGFHQELSGRENTYLFGAILGMSKQQVENKYQEIIDFSGIAAFMESPIKYYSSGMQVRLAFSVYAFSEPDILLIDEALGVGDVNFQQKCIQKMYEQARKNTTILLVSHDLGLVRRFCTRCLYLNKGIIRAVGAPDKVISHYLKEQHLKLDDNKDRSISINKTAYIKEAYIKNKLEVYTAGDDLVIHSILQINQPIDAVYYFIKFIQEEQPAYSAAKFFKKLVPQPNGILLDTLIPLKSLARGHYSFRLELYHVPTDQLLDYTKAVFDIELVGSKNNNDAPVIDSSWQILN